MFYVYILKSNIDNSYYIGSCHGIENRIKLHNRGLVKSTKKGIPWIMVYVENYKNLKSARKRELQIKSWKSRNAIEKLINKHF